jgi:uncharacterized protein (TIGR02246 family)
MREAKDRAEIESLMWRYVRALDTFNADACAAAYTPDGQFGSGANATKGREALAKMITDLRQRSAANETKTGQKRLRCITSSRTAIWNLSIRTTRGWRLTG